MLGRRGQAARVYKALDAILTAPLHAGEKRLDLLRFVLSRSSPNYRRLSSSLALLDRLAPGRLSRRVASSLVNLERFPLGASNVEVIAYGTASTVFRLEVDGQPRVLKVFRRTLGGTAGEGLEVIRRFKQRHGKLCSWFNDPDEVVVSSSFLVLHGPLRGAAAAAVLQPYVAGTKRDIFLDYTMDEAVRLLHANPRLGLQWKRFARRFLDSIEATGSCFDLAGRENLVLVEHQGEMSLKIIDIGIFQLDALRVESPGRYQRLQARVEMLREIDRQLEAAA